MPGPLAILEQALAETSWPGVVLITGTDLDLRDRAVELILDAVPEAERSTSIDRFDGAPIARILDAARTPTLLGGRRVVLAREPEGLGGSEEARDALLAYVTRASGHALLVLIADKVDGRLSIIKQIGKHGLRIDLPLPKERDMPARIAGRAREKGLRLAPPVIQAIADAVGNDPALAAREVDKLALAFGGEKPLAEVSDLATVDSLLRPGRAVGAFELEDALLAGRTRDALRALFRWLNASGAGHALPLLGRLSGIVRRLAVAAEVVGQRGGEGQVREALGCHPFVAKKYTEAARRVGPRAEEALAACVAADGMLKSGQDSRAALARVVVSLSPVTGPRAGRPGS